MISLINWRLFQNTRSKPPRFLVMAELTKSISFVVMTHVRCLPYMTRLPLLLQDIDTNHCSPLRTEQSMTLAEEVQRW